MLYPLLTEEFDALASVTSLLFLVLGFMAWTRFAILFAFEQRKRKWWFSVVFYCGCQFLLLCSVIVMHIVYQSLVLYFTRLDLADKIAKLQMADSNFSMDLFI